MGRPPVSEKINDLIDHFWVQEVQDARAQKRKPNVARVWRAANGVDQARKSVTKLPRGKQKVSLSHVEKRVCWLEEQRRLARREEIPPFPREAFEEALEREITALFNPPEWVPWVSPGESPEETLFLIRVKAAKQSTYRQPLFQHEAQWGRKLRPAIEGLPPISQYRLIEMYSQRQFATEYLKRSPYTEDLDGVIAYRAWLPENQPVYELAVAAGLVPFPSLLPVPTPISSTWDPDLDEFISQTTPDPGERVPGFPFLSYLLEHATGEPDFDESISKAIDRVAQDFPFLTYISEHPQDFPGWSSFMVAERIAPPAAEDLAGSAEDGVDPRYIQMADQFLKFWSGAEPISKADTPKATKEGGAVDEREYS